MYFLLLHFPLVVFGWFLGWGWIGSAAADSSSHLGKYIKHKSVEYTSKRKSRGPSANNNRTKKKTKKKETDAMPFVIYNWTTTTTRSTEFLFFFHFLKNEAPKKSSMPPPIWLNCNDIKLGMSYQKTWIQICQLVSEMINIITIFNVHNKSRFRMGSHVPLNTIDQLTRQIWENRTAAKSHF